MFASKKTIPARAADVLDLMIEFATLGEYGLEYPEEAHPVIGKHTTCSGNRGAHTARECEGRQTVRRTPRSVDRRGFPEPIDYRAALRTPRIRLSFTD
jgi:hypothetical protein